MYCTLYQLMSENESKPKYILDELKEGGAGILRHSERK